MKKLETARDVFEAFLRGQKLIWRMYGDDESGDMYLYMDSSGIICEEDGAGVKSHRIDISFRDEDPNWRILA